MDNPACQLSGTGSDKFFEEFDDATAAGATGWLRTGRRDPHHKKFRRRLPPGGGEDNFALETGGREIENLWVFTILNRQQFPAALGKTHGVGKDLSLLGLAAAFQFIVPPAVTLAAC